MLNQEASVRFSEKNSTLVADLSGDIDHHSAFRVREKIDMELYARRPQTLVLSLANVSFMDSSGLGLILGRMNKANEVDADFILADPSPQIEKILDLAGIERMIKIERNEKNEKIPG